MKDSSLRSSGKSTKTSKNRHNIILVDDETDIAHVLKRGLEVKGFEVDAYDSPQEAINSFKPNLYDLAILDIRMPGLNGFALYRQMKKIDPSLTACFLSAFEMHLEEFQKVFPSMSESVKAIIKKPVSIDALIKEISPFLRISSFNKAVYGDHMFIVFETKREIIDAAFEFLRIGLIENNEDGIFNIERNKARFGEIMKCSLKRGAKGVRSVGEMTPLFELDMIKELITWESAINRKLDMPIKIICGLTKDNVSELAPTANLTLRHDHSKVVEPK